MSTHTGFTRGSRGGSIFPYMEREFVEGRKAAEDRGLTAYLSEDQTVTPTVMGSGLEDFGLSIGQTITSEVAESIWGELRDPETGKPYGQKLACYPGVGELLCRAAAERGLELPKRLEPEAVRKAVVAGEITDQTISRRIGKVLREQLPEAEVREMRAAARRDKKQEARPWLGFTTSMSKDAALLHAAFMHQGQYDDARKVIVCLYEAVGAQLEVLERRVGSNQGRNRVQAIDATRLAALVYPHPTSRAGDPDPHLHVLVANRVRCADGKFRALDGAAFFEAKPLVAAVGARVFDEAMVRTFGVRYRYDPKRKGHIIEGVTDEMMDLFSERTGVIAAEVARREKQFEADFGRKMTPLQRHTLNQQVSYATRQAKAKDQEATPERLARWSKKFAALQGQTFDDLLEAVFPDRQVAVERPTYDPEVVVGQVLEAVRTSGRNTMRVQDMAMAVGHILPPGLGLGRDRVEKLLWGLGEQASKHKALRCVSAGDPIGDVPAEFRRDSDGGSVYGPRSLSQRFALVETLDQEQRLLTLALQTGAPKAETEAAAAAVAARSQVLDPNDPAKVTRPGLRADQAQTIEAIATDGKALSVLIGPAGAGKSYTLAQLREVWTHTTGGEVVGLAPSDAAANVLEAEGFALAANTAKWLHMQRRLASDKAKRSDQAFALKPGMLVVVDEASMVSTPDLDRIAELVTAAGAKLVWAGDDHQLAAVERSGALRMVTQNHEVQRSGAVNELVEVARFIDPREGANSLELRRGNPEALHFLDRQGRIRSGTAEEMAEAAFRGFMTDYLAGRNTLLLVPTNELAAEMAARIQAELVALGRVSLASGVRLHNGYRAGVGDVVQARENAPKIVDPSTGKGISNRDTFEVVGVNGQSLVVRRVGRGQSFTLPAEYVARHVESAWASTVHAAQGRSVDTAWGIVDANGTREQLYVMLTRGRARNMGLVITDAGEGPSHEPLPVRESLDVLAEVLARSDAEITATEFRAQDLEAMHSLARLHQVWDDLMDRAAFDEHRAVLVDALGADVATTVADDAGAPALWRVLQAARDEGHDSKALLAEAIASRDLDGARSVAKVLHSRVAPILAERPPNVVPPEAKTFRDRKPEFAVATTYLERTPEPQGIETPGLVTTKAHMTLARQVAEAMDRRIEVLVERALQDAPEPPRTPEAVEAWKDRMRPVVAYREAHGIRSDLYGPDPIGPAPSRAVQPERYRAWQLADAALGHPDRSRDANRLTDAGLRAAIVEWDATYRKGPENVERTLAEARVALGDAEWDLQRSLDVSEGKSAPAIDMIERVERLRAEGKSSPTIDGRADKVERLRAEVEDLDRTQTAWDQWWDEHAGERELAGNARHELSARHPEVEPSQLFPPTPEERAAEERRLDDERARQPEPERAVERSDPSLGIDF